MIGVNLLRLKDLHFTFDVNPGFIVVCNLEISPKDTALETIFKGKFRLFTESTPQTMLFDKNGAFIFITDVNLDSNLWI